MTLTKAKKQELHRILLSIVSFFQFCLLINCAPRCSACCRIQKKVLGKIGTTILLISSSSAQFNEISSGENKKN